MEIVALIQEARSAGLAVDFNRDELILVGPRWLASYAEQLVARKWEVLAALRADLPIRWGGTTRRLIGNGFPTKPVTVPPAAILANVVLCPVCGSRRVLPELASITGGHCWECDDKAQRNQPEGTQQVVNSCGVTS